MNYEKVILSTDCDAGLHPLRFWRGVGEQDAKRKGGFRYSGRMVAGYGFGSDLHLSRIPGYYNVYHLRCSLLNFYVIRCKAQGCIHVLLSMRLSSADCFLYAFAENYLFPSLPSHEIKAIIGSYIIFVNGIFLRCNFHKVIL